MSYIMLSLDISTSTTGYAVWEDGIYIRSGVLRRTTRQSETDNVLTMGRLLLNLLDRILPNHISIENTYSTNGFNSSRNLDRLHGIVLGWAIKHNAYIDYIYIAEWRKWLKWPSSGQLKKDGVASPSRWYKRKSIQRAQKLYDATITDDNEADAVNIGEAIMLRFQQQASKRGCHS